MNDVIEFKNYEEKDAGKSTGEDRRYSPTEIIKREHKTFSALTRLVAIALTW